MKQNNTDATTLHREFELLDTTVHIPDGKASYAENAWEGATLAVTPPGDIGEISQEEGSAIIIELPNGASAEAYIEESQLETLYEGLRGHFGGSESNP